MATLTDPRPKHQVAQVAAQTAAALATPEPSPASSVASPTSSGSPEPDTKASSPSDDGLVALSVPDLESLIRKPIPKHIRDNWYTLVSSHSVATTDTLVQPIAKALHSSLVSDSAANMLPSCISRLPSGSEAGKFIAMDLGGSTLRVALVELTGAGSHCILYSSRNYVDNHTRKLPGLEFFSWIVARLGDTLALAVQNQWLEPDHPPVPVGLSWSFPFIQTSVDRGALEPMGKGYTAGDDLHGQNIKDCVEKAARAMGVRVVLTALVNDTAALLLSRAYISPRTRMSLVLGTGINSGAVFPATRVAPGKFSGLQFGAEAADQANMQVLVNTELSMVGGQGVIPLTDWDRALDSAVEKPGFQPLETLVSGRYLGEIVRYVVCDFVKHSLLFDGKLPHALDTPYALLSATVAAVEEHMHDGNLSAAWLAFAKHHPLTTAEPQITPPLADIQLLCTIILAVSTRAAALSAASLMGLACTLPVAESDPLGVCEVAYAGTVLEKYPLFVQRFQQYLDLLGSRHGRRLKMELAEEGSLTGAAIASAMYS